MSITVQKLLPNLGLVALSTEWQKQRRHGLNQRREEALTFYRIKVNRKYHLGANYLPHLIKTLLYCFYLLGSIHITLSLVKVILMGSCLTL